MQQVAIVKTGALPHNAPILRRFLTKLVIDVFPAALTSVVGGVLVAHYQFGYAVQRPATEQVAPASVEMVKLVRDEHSAIMDYLKAVERLGSAADGRAVVATMKATPIDDPLFGHVTIREDGRAMHDMYLLQVKTPAESKGPWDVFNVTGTIPAEQAFRPLKDGGCPLIANQN